MLDDHAVQQGADGVETAHVQTCEVGNSVKQCVYTTSWESTELSVIMTPIRGVSETESSPKGRLSIKG